MQFMQHVQMQSLLKCCASHNLNIKWHYLNGTRETDIIATKDIEKMISPPYYEWFDGNSFAGLNDSLRSIQDYVHTHNIDGVLGFSQGAAMASIVSQYEPIKFGIFVCGVNCRHPDYDSINFSKPSYHFIGTKDPVKHRSYDLANMFDQSRIIDEVIYDHRFPMFPKNYVNLMEFIKGQWKNVEKC